MKFLLGKVKAIVSRGSAGTAATYGRSWATTENPVAEPRTKPGNLQTQSKSPTAFCSVMQAACVMRTDAFLILSICFRRLCACFSTSQILTWFYPFVCEV